MISTMEGLVIKTDELDNPDRRNYSINSMKGSFGDEFFEVVRLANLSGVNIEATPEFKKLNDVGKNIAKKLALLNNKGIVYLEITQKSITAGKESAIRWRDLQPLILSALQSIFESVPQSVQVEDRTGLYSEFGVLSEYI